MGDRTPSPTRRNFNPNNRHENLRKRKGEERAMRDPELARTELLIGWGGPESGYRWHGYETFGVVPHPAKTPERRPNAKPKSPSRKPKTVSRVYKPKRGGGRRVTRRHGKH